MRASGFETAGWTLNVSQGGIRVILEERLSPDLEYDVSVGETDAPRKAVVVWTQDESDGQIVGLKFLDAEGSVPPQDSAPSPGSESPPHEE